MKKISLLLAAFIMQFTALQMKGQVRLESGDLRPLLSAGKVNIIYDYSNLGVGAFRNEKDYLKKKEEDYKNNPEKYIKFENGWFNARKERYEPKFESLFNKGAAKAGFIGQNYSTDGSITLKVVTVFIEPGYNTGFVPAGYSPGPMKKPSTIDLECIFYDNNGKEFAKYFLKNIPGVNSMGADFDVGSRLQESYAKAGKALMKDINKQLKKLK